MKYIQQLDCTDCGAACLGMIASHFGKSLNIAEVRNVAGTDALGTNMYGMVTAAKHYGLTAHAVKGDMSILDRNTPTPFIAHEHIREDEKNFDHYVVVAKITDTYIWVWNPDPLVRKKRISRGDFSKSWTGYALFAEPNAAFKSGKRQNLFLQFLPVFLPHKKELVFSFLASLLLILFGIAFSFYYKYIFDDVVYSNATSSLITLSLAMFVIMIFQAGVEAIRSVLLSHFSFKTNLQFNFSYIAHVLKMPLSFFESRKSGEILSRLSDLEKIKKTISGTALSSVMDIVMLLITAPLLLHINSQLFIVSLCSVLLLATSAVIFGKINRTYYSRILSQNADVQSYLFESINGVATVKAMNCESIVNAKYEELKMKATASSWELNRFSIGKACFSSLVRGCARITVILLGCMAIISGTFSLGALITFNTLLGYFTGPLYRIITAQNEIQEAIVAARRVGEILELDNEIDETKKYYQPEKIDGHIEFRDITFRYGSRCPVYEHFTLEIPPHSWTAFVGASGCGKSTLVKLLLKFYIPEEGSILIDGNNIFDMQPQYLRSVIGYVPQDIFMFSGTVADNIALHKPNASMSEIILAAQKAGAHEFIEQLPDRYNTMLNEHGGGLSGGEKQRLALARALVGNPQLLILDEATSNLDTVSESQIQTVLRQLKDDNITVIIIAHRLSTVRNCDTIYVLDDGDIVQSGTHEQLLSIEGLYRRMWEGVQ